MTATDFLDTEEKPAASSAADFLDTDPTPAPSRTLSPGQQVGFVRTVQTNTGRKAALNQPFAEVQPSGEVIQRVPGNNPDQNAETFLEGPGKALTYAGNVARAIPADVAAGLAADPSASGNIPAAVTGQPLPIDEKLSLAAGESPIAATVGKVAQGVAAAAPLAAVGALPTWAAKLVAAGFSAQMISQTPKLARELGEELGKNPADRDQDKLTSLISDAIQTGVFAPLAGAHAAGDFLESKLTPTTYVAHQLAKQLKTAELPDMQQPGNVKAGIKPLPALPGPIVAADGGRLQRPSPLPEPDPTVPVATSPQAESATPPASAEAPATVEPKLVPVDVTAAQIKSFRSSASVETPPDILSTIEDHFPGGVKFESKADYGDYLNSAKGRAKELMSHTAGEPADKVLDGLHLAGEFHGIENVDNLAQAMVNAGDTRINARSAVNEQARSLAEDQARTQQWEATALRPRSGESEPVPVPQLFVGDTFTVKGQPMKVMDFATDGDTGKPFGVEVEGAYGRQTVPVDQALHIDKGSLKEGPTDGRMAASGTSAPGLLTRWATK